MPAEIGSGLADEQFFHEATCETLGSVAQVVAAKPTGVVCEIRIVYVFVASSLANPLSEDGRMVVARGVSIRLAMFLL